MTTERSFRFGRALHLVGIAGFPVSAAAAAAAADRVGIIMLNAGMVHRVGPFRLHVTMARRLNACGYPTLRFDMSSVGDSGASAESQSQALQVRADVADAMDLMQEQAGCTRFVLIGLCSGAQSAHTVACTEPRVAGAVFLDGYAYRTFGFRLRHYLPRLLSLPRWGKFLARRLRPSKGRSANVFAIWFPPLAQARRDLTGMLDRGLTLRFIFSGGAIRYFNHPRQLRECYGDLATRPRMSVRQLKNADHTYVLEVDRKLLLDDIVAWLQSSFPIPLTSTPP
jgi:pimeloyl-ACP methyl ester carboxylesterase